MLPKNLSIATRLTISIIFIQLIALYLTIGYLIYDSMKADSKTFAGGIPDSKVRVISDAVSYNAHNELIITSTASVNGLLSQPGAWVIVSDNNGQSIRSGKIPAPYEALINDINSLGGSEVSAVRENSALSMKMTIKTVANKTLRIMVGGVPVYEPEEIFAGLASIISFKIFMPMALVAIILIPLITRRILSGLSSAANDAKHINESDRQARIRVEGIPGEVMPLVKAVNGALQRLSEGHQERDRFLSSAAHELRAPIAIIEARLSIIQDNKTRNILANDVARLSNLAESLLDLQRLSKGLSGLSGVHLKKTLRQVISDYSPMIISSGYDIEYISCDEDVIVKGDEASLSRAVINILQNAVIYGGGKGLITVWLSKEGFITIEDEGPGIPQVQRERVFEPFQRVIPRAQGAGLGLHLVQEIVQMHKGTVTAGEGRRGGALFEIRLPVLAHPDFRK